jgi:hypothetical protein
MRKKFYPTVEASKSMPLAQKEPLFLSNYAGGAGPPGLDVSLRNDPFEPVLAITPFLPRSIKVWVSGALLAGLLVYSYSVLPVVSASPGSLLREIKAAFLSVVAPCLPTTLRAMPSGPQAPMLFVPSLVHAADFVRIRLSPALNVGL